MFCNFVFSHEVCRPIVVAALSKRVGLSHVGLCTIVRVKKVREKIAFV